MIWVCVEFELLVVHFLTSGCYQRQSRQVRSFDEVGVCLVWVEAAPMVAACPGQWTAEPWHQTDGHWWLPSFPAGQWWLAGISRLPQLAGWEGSSDGRPSSDTRLMATDSWASLLAGRVISRLPHKWQWGKLRWTAKLEHQDTDGSFSPRLPLASVGREGRPKGASYVINILYLKVNHRWW